MSCVCVSNRQVIVGIYHWYRLVAAGLGLVPPPLSHLSSVEQEMVLCFPPVGAMPPPPPLISIMRVWYHSPTPPGGCHWSGTSYQAVHPHASWLPSGRSQINKILTSCVFSPSLFARVPPGVLLVTPHCLVLPGGVVALTTTLLVLPQISLLANTDEL